jgi:hypothetical protein
MDTLTKTLLFCVLAVALIALFVFWPGTYQYHNTHDGILVRVNRYTGQTEYYIVTTGWKISTPPESTPKQPPPNYIDPYSSPTPSPGR